MKNWNDIYKLPIAESYIDEDDGFRSKRILDANENFIFQFLNVTDNAQIKALEAINGTSKLENKDVVFTHEDGYILANDNKVIMIRGWGNLTGTGGYNLSSDEAANVQDTFADYIVSKLNER
tara:strand:+ start:235 stop:600 length:366 start_codon:yes stop_codon:yes gene_type:complete